MKSDWLLLALTAVIGFLCGAWLYLTVFIPEYVENPYVNELIEEATVNFTINAEEYGECEPYGDCRAFSVDGDREYRYQDISGDFYDGRLTTVQLNNVIAALEQGQLLDREQRCRSDEVNHVQYSIYYDDNYYVIEACNGGSAAEPVRTMNDLWQFFLELALEDFAEEEEEESDEPLLPQPTDVLFSPDVVE